MALKKFGQLGNWFLSGVVLVAMVPGCVAQPAKVTPGTVAYVVSPAGRDSDAGTPERPFATLERAQRAVRESNLDHDVVVQLESGIYRVKHPLCFRAVDGGQNGHRVTWQAAEHAQPVISGAMKVSGWKIFDRAKNIYVADVPAGMDSRQLWIDDALAKRGSVEIPRSKVEFTNEGVIFKDGDFDYVSKLAQTGRLELEGTGFFTDRFSPVERVDGRKLVMKQPAWNNNIWGYDAIPNPYHPELSHLFLVNASEFLSDANQWYVDRSAGKLYVRFARGARVENTDVEFPRVEVLMSVGGTLEEPVRNLTFRGIRFSHTSWLGPLSAEGYASQQSGAYLAGRAAMYPADPLVSCRFGCPAFETMRNEWMQMPASVQVSAAELVTFDQNVFAHLGQYALGIGNDANATLTGVGLATSDVVVTGNVFYDVGGGAVLAGGVRRDAHHPSDVRMINRQLIVRNNFIRAVSKEYRDNSAILSTYVEGAVILHNEITDVPYDAIDIGYGWGMHDMGGNPNYRVRMHGYDWKDNLVYQTPTTHRDVVVASNKIHSAKQYFHDGGAVYNLSASPGTLITENYIYDNSGMIGLYLDEGSRYIMVRRNVVADFQGEWLNVNTVHSAYPLRISPDNTATGNWHDGTKVGGLWTNYQNNLILDDHLVMDGQWPTEAKAVMKNSGVESGAHIAVYPAAEKN